MPFDTIGAAAYRQAVMTSEDPDLDWIVRGWRGLRSYLARAIRAIEQGDLAAQTSACRGASDLLVLLQRITPAADDTSLGHRLRTIYDALHLQIAKANAEQDKRALQQIVQAVARLESDVQGAYAGASAVP